MIKRKFIYTLMLATFLVGLYSSVAFAWAVNDATNPVVSPTSVTVGKGKTAKVTVTYDLAKTKTGAGPTSGFKAETAASEVATVKHTSTGDSTATTTAAGKAEVVFTVTGVAAGETTITVGINASGKTKDVTVNVTENSGPAPASTAPKFHQTATEVGTALKGTYGTAFEAAVEIPVSSDSKVTWTVTGLPKGYTVYNADGEEVTPKNGVWTVKTEPTSDVCTLTIGGTPGILTPSAGASVTIKAENKIGSSTLSPKVVVKAGEDDTTAFSEATSTALTEFVGTGDDAGKKVVDEAFSAIALEATPGPITWKAENLPAGMTLTVDATDSTKASIAAGKFTTATKIKDGVPQSAFKITATNPYMKSGKNVAKFEGNVQVFASPKLTTTKLSDVTIGKDWKAPVKFTGNPTGFTITWSDNLVDGEDAKPIPQVDGDPADQKAKKGSEKGTKGIYFDPDDLTFKGQLDRYPTDRQFTVTVVGQNFANKTEAGEDATETFTVKVKGDAPKLPSLGTINGAKADGTEIKATGTWPITMSAYVAKRDYEKLFGEGEPDYPADADDKTDYSLSKVGLVATPGTTAGENDGKLTITPGEDIATFAFKGLPITVVASNDEKKVTKTYKVDVAGADPTWDRNPEEGKKSIERTVLAGSETPLAEEFVATVLQPYEITVSPKEKNGLTATLGEGDDATKVTIAGTPTANKDTKTSFTLTATNTSTKKKATVKVDIIGKYPPVIDDKDFSTEVVYPKQVKIKATAKGSKTITWAIAEDSETDADALENLGLTFDETKGTITGTPTEVTYDGTGTNTPKKVKLEAHNDVTAPEVDTGATAPATEFTISVKGAKPKIKTKTITISKNEDNNDASKMVIETDPAYNADTNLVKMKFSPAAPMDGLALDADTGAITPTVATLEATKGKSVEITVNNAGSEVKGKVKFVITDVQPVIDDVAAVAMTAQEKSKATETVDLSLTAGCTGDTKIKWAIKTQPQKASAKIKGSGDSATLTLTLPKGVYNTDKTSDAIIATSVVVTATNQATKEVGEKEIKINITPCVEEAEEEEEETSDALPETTYVALPDDAHKRSTGTGEVKLGQARTVAGLTAGERTIVNAEGYIIAAVLPEVTVTEDGQYDLNVELAEEVKEGAELKYFAFPRNAEASSDDEICDFYDEEGNAIEAVPASHKITVSPWFNANVTYAPVIAVKADTGAEGAKTAEEIEAEVTE